MVACSREREYGRVASLPRAKGIRVSLHGRERTVALVASRVDRRIEEEKEKKNFEKNGRLRSLYRLKKKYLSLRRTCCRPWSTLSIIVIIPSFPL